MKIKQNQLSIISPNLIQTTLESTNGFLIYTDNDLLLGDYSEYTTLYRELEGAYQYSNDGSVYIEPIPHIPTEEEIAEELRQEKINKIYNEISIIDSEFKSLDYVGIKIATGRATVDEYKTEIARMIELATLKDELEKEIKTL